MQDNQLLNKAECSMLKAVAIVMIVCHNFAHLIKGMVSENEYSFDIFRTSRMWHSILEPDASLLLNVLSFFGHYGVPVFLFLSGYGLVKKYERGSGVGIGVLPFVAKHYKKLLKLLLPGLVVFLAVTYWKYGIFKTTKVNVAAQVTMVINLLSEPWMRIKPGPYWFFGLMMQLYVIYRLLLFAQPTARLRRWLGPLLLAVVCHVAQVVGVNYGALYWMRYNFFVAGVPFAMGLLVARYDCRVAASRWLWLAVSALACVVTFASNFRFQLWLASGIPVVIAAVALVKALPPVVHKPLVWLGGLSAMLFVVHPIVRMLLLDYATGVAEGYLFLSIYLVISVLLAIAYRWLLAKVKI